MESKIQLPKLCSDNKCTACCACYNACRKGAITMKEDQYGELHPCVDESLCVGCGLCERSCPELEANTLERYGKPEIYSCWLKNADDRRESTSGGAAFALSCAIIKKGGHVWGAAYDENMSCCYQEANSIEELRPIQKSKYVQSYVWDCYRKIEKQLKAGDLVLFTGTSCHVKGLRTYLHKDYANLFTMDLVCHGVPGQGVFKKYINWLEEKYGDKVINYTPRNKAKDGQERWYYTQATFKNKGDVKLELRNNGYFVGFQHNLFLRTNCFNCAANGEQRFADFTVADFWGLGKTSPFHHNMERPKGISMMAVNSEKAKALFKEIEESIVFEKRSYEEASVSNTQYYRPAIPSPRRDKFREEWQLLTWDEITDKYLRLSHKEVLLYYVKKFTPPHLLSYAKSVAKREQNLRLIDLWTLLKDTKNT